VHKIKDGGDIMKIKNIIVVAVLFVLFVFPNYAFAQTKDVVFQENIVVEDGTKLDYASNKYVISDDNEYIVIKQANGKVVVWTPVEVNVKQQQEFKTGFLALNVDKSVKSFFQFYFVHGYSAFDMSIVSGFGNRWGTYTFSHVGDNIILNCLKSKVSHINFGNIKLEEEEEEKPVVTCNREVKYFIYQGMGYNYNNSNYRYYEYEINSTQTVEKNMFTNEGYTFVAWSRVGSGKTYGINKEDIINYSTSLDYYAPGYKFTLSNSYTFYGVWAEQAE